MLSFIGEGALYCALVASLIGIFKQRKYYIITVAVFMAAAFFILLYGHVTNDFSLLDVVMHSHTHKPFLYKVCGIWGYHEGSYLFLLTLYAAVSCMHSDGQQSYTSSVSLCLFVLILIAIIQVNPFLKLAVTATQGEDLNPVLQDMMISIHPPILYMGHALLLVLFAIGITQKKLNQVAIKTIQSWARASWFFLTLGIMLGSFWAYNELGWGGVWFWDPVENLSLIPWLVVTALLHNIKMNGSFNSTRLLAILGFLLSTLSILIVRSGIVVSVHNFAYAEQFLTYFATAVALFFTLGIYGYSRLREPCSRQTPRLLTMHHTLLGLFGSILLFGVLYPLISSMWGQNGVVGESFYQSSLIPLLLGIPFLAAISKFFKKNKSQYLTLLIILMAAGCVSLYLWEDWPLVAHFYHSTAWALIIMTIKGAMNGASFKKAVNIRMVMAHGGLGIMMLGLVYAHYNQKEFFFDLVDKKDTFQVTKEITLNPYQIKHIKRSNHNSEQLQVRVLTGGDEVCLLQPERRAYWVKKLMHHESDTCNVGLIQIYTQLLSPNEKTLQLQVIIKPCIWLVWFGVLIMLLGFAVGSFLRSSFFSKLKKVNY